MAGGVNHLQQPSQPTPIPRAPATSRYTTARPHRCPSPPQLYEARDLGEQRRIIRRHYADQAVYQNNIMRIQGAEGIARRFSLLPRTTKSVGGAASRGRAH